MRPPRTAEKRSPGAARPDEPDLQVVARDAQDAIVPALDDDIRHLPDPGRLVLRGPYEKP